MPLANVVQRKLANDYGIRDIPAELLEYFVRCKRTRLGLSPVAPVASTIAFLIACDWQRGKTLSV